MVQRKGMLGLVRFRMLRAGISKYSTLRLASSSGLWAASRAMPTSAMAYFRLLFAFWQEVCATTIQCILVILLAAQTAPSPERLRYGRCQLANLAGHHLGFFHGDEVRSLRQQDLASAGESRC